MDITYLGHSSFRLKGKNAIVVCDPYEAAVGFRLPAVTADIVTVSHQHGDHNAAALVKPAGARTAPFLIQAPGEYEISGVSIFGYQTFHDEKTGADYGKNTIYAIVIDGVTVVHLGDLGHMLDDGLMEKLGEVDVLLCPVGGHHQISPKGAVELIQEIEPSYVIPMHYKTPAHAPLFADIAPLSDFEKVFGVTSEPVKSLSVSAGTVVDQTTLVVLE